MSPGGEQGRYFRGGFSTPGLWGTWPLPPPLPPGWGAGGALEPLNRRDAGGLCLPIAKTGLFDHIQALDGFIALEYELNERMFFGAWPCCRVDRQHQKLALGDDRCQRMQEFHPAWPGRELGKQYRSHRRCI